MVTCGVGHHNGESGPQIKIEMVQCAECLAANKATSKAEKKKQMKQPCAHIKSSSVSQNAADLTPLSIQIDYTPTAPLPVTPTNAQAVDQDAPEANLLARDFQFVRVIGKGAFGTVFLVRDRASGQLHAMKISSKKHILQEEIAEGIAMEREVMATLRHPFLLQLDASYQTKSNLVFVMEYEPGGELFEFLKNEGLLREESARFYLAEIVLAIDHLHANGLVHRDLKSENMLISRLGHVKLTDFGLAARFQPGKTPLQMICGTKEYMAPEMILGKGYDQTVDWWSLGILAHEMLVGKAPFRHSNPRQLQKKILSERLHLPKWLSSQAHSLLKSLLHRDAHKRLGANGIQQVKDHPFFRGINWDDLVNLRVVPPMTPDLQSDVDTKYFDSKFTTLAPLTELSWFDAPQQQQSPKPHKQQERATAAVEEEEEEADADFRHFDGFTHYGPQELQNPLQVVHSTRKPHHPLKHSPFTTARRL